MSRIIAVEYGLAFSHKAGIDGKPVAGNPAGVIVCEGGLPTRNQMSDLASVACAGIVAFVSQREENEFDIRFFFPYGKDCYLCGHGTLAAAFAINKLFDYREIVFHHHAGFTLRCELDHNKFVSVELPAYPLVPLDVGRAAIYRKLLNLGSVDLVNEYYCPELKDFVLVMEDGNLLRQLSPDYAMLSQQIIDHNSRALMVTARSKNDIIDYEARIFCPHVESEKDISCGSANCYLLPLWKKAIHTNGQSEDLVILCPFRPESDFFGGIEYGNFDAEKNTVTIAGFITEMKSTQSLYTNKWLKSG